MAPVVTGPRRAERQQAAAAQWSTARRRVGGRRLRKAGAAGDQREDKGSARAGELAQPVRLNIREISPNWRANLPTRGRMTSRDGLSALDAAGIWQRATVKPYRRRGRRTVPLGPAIVATLAHPRGLPQASGKASARVGLLGWNRLRPRSANLKLSRAITVWISTPPPVTGFPRPQAVGPGRGSDVELHVIVLDPMMMWFHNAYFEARTRRPPFSRPLDDVRRAPVLVIVVRKSRRPVA